MNTKTNLFFFAAGILAALLLVGCEKNNKEFRDIDDQKGEVWFKQTSVDLGAKIKMVDEENGLAISRGNPPLPQAQKHSTKFISLNFKILRFSIDFSMRPG